jgi:Tol biopolymer transport system component/biopolymer transport protein ExbD
MPYYSLRYSLDLGIFARLTSAIAFVLIAIVGTASSSAQDASDVPSIESRFIQNARQVTFEGKRAGEGYFSADGNLMVFQSERRSDNPFYQIYLLDFETGDQENISPGHGKTTCAWIHPNNDLVLYASTQNDPEAKAKQKAELEFRESGQERRYSWDYDENYELFAFSRQKKSFTQLTNARGYDAEASYSPDGNLIAFASNRNGYNRELTEREQKMFDVDPAYMMDIFIMNSDGSNVRQLTDVPGYDGGPFFSPDGKSICWRRFSENGLRAEIMTMNIDGSNQRRITNMKAMSWAPFYHSSGDYLIFTTNKQGFSNFELYMVDAQGKSDPVRVTDTDGFDGLASFLPGGKRITWTSNRTPGQASQIFIADWNHDAALAALKQSKPNSDADSEAFESGTTSAKQSSSDFRPADIVRHVKYLCRPALGGRMTGSAGERKAVSYVAAYFDYLGLEPAGDDAGWFQRFDFPNGAKLNQDNQLTLSDGGKSTELTVGKDWRPLTFSGNVNVDPTEVVFAGYGIVAPAKGEFEEYDSYVHLDVKDKWVLAFRFVPEDVSPAHRRHLQFYANLRKKAFYARSRGAKGLIIASGPTSQVRSQLVALVNDFSPSGSSIAAISVSDDVAAKLLASKQKDLAAIQKKLDSGEPMMGFNLASGANVAANVSIEKITGVGRNVVGRLQAGDTPSAEVVVVGAHIDHLGTGKSSSSLAKDAEKGAIHFGADDNASGVAAMLEIAEYLSNLKKKGKLPLKRDIIFAGWSGEELGLHGSKHFAKTFNVGKENSQAAEQAKPAEAQDDSPRDSSHDFNIAINAESKLTLNGKLTNRADLKKELDFIGKSFPDFPITIKSDPASDSSVLAEVIALANSAGIKNTSLTTTTQQSSTSQPTNGIVAALNMDMIGRLTDKLVLQGISSSPVWPKLIESKNAVVGLPVTLSDETDLPTDASSFYQIGVPILSAFTGSHRDYHTPRDTPEKRNYRDAARIARLMGLVTRSLVLADEAPKFVKQASKTQQAGRGGMRAYLGTVPSYGEDVTGVLLSDTTEGAPAQVAGVRGGDIIVELADAKIENIYDYTAILDTLKIGRETTIKVKRDGKILQLKLTPQSRK